jgi:hypothetical protein
LTHPKIPKRLTPNWLTPNPLKGAKVELFIELRVKVQLINDADNIGKIK